jgi:hypothetical protein
MCLNCLFSVAYQYLLKGHTREGEAEQIHPNRGTFRA